MKIVVYDLEIVNDIDKINVGWTDFHKMHVSVGCAYDYTTGDYRVFCQDNLQGLVDLLAGADLVAAFNNKSFDNALIAAEAKRLDLRVEGGTEAFKAILDDKSYDMLVESRKGAGVSNFAKGFKLDDHLRAIWGEALLKTEDGALAPRLWREGNVGKIIDYCLADVRRERQLFEWAWYGGQFRCATSKGHSVRRPQELLGISATARLPFFGGQFTDKAINTIIGQFTEEPKA